MHDYKLAKRTSSELTFGDVSAIFDTHPLDQDRIDRLEKWTKNE